MGGKAGARADGEEIPQGRVGVGDELDFRREVGGAGADAAGDDENVERRDGVEGVRGQDELREGGVGAVVGRVADLGGHGGEGAGDESEGEVVAPGEEVEGVKRAEDVERLEAGEEEVADGVGEGGRGGGEEGAGHNGFRGGPEEVEERVEERFGCRWEWGEGEGKE